MDVTFRVPGRDGQAAGPDVSQLVRSIVTETLGIDPHRCVTDPALHADLGLDSLDVLDLFFRIERRSPVLLSVERFAAYLQGDVPDEEFCDARGRISERGLQRLRTVMPQLDTDAWPHPPTFHQALQQLTVGNLAAMVEHLLTDQGRCGRG